MSSSNNSGMNAGSGSEGVGIIDEKKRRRMASNRESARRSRQRKQQHLDDLIKQVGSLQRENDEFGKKIGEFSGVFGTVEAQNKVLRAEKDRLAARLESLENIIEIAKVVRGSNNNNNTNNNNTNNNNGLANRKYNRNGNNNNNNDDENEFLYEVNSDPMMKPWQLPCPSMPIFASSGLGRRFNFEP